MNKEWEIKRLGEVCNILNGGTPKTGVKEYWDGNVKWITPKDMGKLTSKFVDDTPRKITSLGLKKSSAKLIPSNSLILSTRAPIGHLAINTSEMATNQGCRGIIPSNEINIQYLYFFLSNSIDLLNSLGTGATFRELSTKALSSVKIPLPPIPEQKRIVKILDEAFVAIDKSKANAEKNLQNSRELFDSYLNKVFANPGEDWEEKKLGDVCEVIAGQSPAGKYYNKVGEGLPFYQGKKEFTDKYLGKPTTWTTNITKEAQKDDVLMSVRAPVGPINFSTQKICIGRGLAAIRASEIINKDFLFNFLLKHENEIVGNTGAVFNSINKTQIKNLNILLPPLSEQKRIVSKLNALSAETKKLELIYQQKLADLEELKKSILQKAFDGELTRKS